MAVVDVVAGFFVVDSQAEFYLIMILFENVLAKLKSFIFIIVWNDWWRSQLDANRLIIIDFL